MSKKSKPKAKSEANPKRNSKPHPNPRPEPKPKPSPKPILILGVGNLLLKDEGIGIHFAQIFQKRDLAPNVEVMEGGARGIDLLPLFEGRRLVVIVDCGRMGERPGTIRTFSASEIIEKKGNSFSMHGMSLGNTLDLGQRLGVLPDVLVVAVEPEIVDIEIGLSETAQRALGEIERIVMELVRTKGISKSNGT